MGRKGAVLFLFLLVIPAITVSPPGLAVSDPIRIGVASPITPVETVKYYQDIVDYITEKIGQPVEMVYSKTYAEMDEMLEKGEVEVAFVCSAPYIEDRRKFGAELLVAPQVDGKASYRSYIIVHKDSGIERFDELKNKTFAFTDPRSNSGKLYPEYSLARKGHRIEKFFKRYIYSYSHNKSIELVAKKIVDGAAVESLMYRYMKQSGSPYVKMIRIIETSSDFGIPPVIASTNTSIFAKEKIREILVAMHEDRKGKAILDAMLIDRFVVVPDSNYDSIREMEAFVADFKLPDAGEAEKKKETVFFGIVPRDNPRIAYEKFQSLMDHLSDYSPFRFELVLKRSYEETVTALGRGEIDVALLGPLTYLHARKEFGAISILKTVTEKGEPFYRSVVVTKENHPAKTLSDLRGKDVAFAALKSTSGNLIPRYILAEEGIHLSELRTYNNFNYHDSVVKWVLKGKYDAGAVRESVAEKYLPFGIRVIATSEPIPTGPLVVGPETPYTIVEALKKRLLDLDRTEEGTEVLQRVDPELRGGFVEADDSDYEHIRKMINDVPKTCGMGCHPKIRL
jgi:phosphonate transport system substrate-binding protein